MAQLAQFIHSFISDKLHILLSYFNLAAGAYDRHNPGETL